MVLVLLRGLIRDSRHWNGLENQLKSTKTQVITPDLPGNGVLTDSTSPLLIKEYADAIWQQINQQTDSAIVIVGVSMGGMLALSMAKHSPHRVKQVIIINASANNLSPWYQRFQILSVLKAVIISQKSLHFSWLESSIIALTSKHRKRDIQLICHWTRLRCQQKTSCINAIRQLIASARFQAQKIKPKVSVIYATQDKLVNPTCSRALADFYQTSAIEITDSGHDIGLDQPDKLIHKLNKMLLA